MAWYSSGDNIGIYFISAIDVNDLSSHLLHPFITRYTYGTTLYKENHNKHGSAGVPQSSVIQTYFIFIIDINDLPPHFSNVLIISCVQMKTWAE
jgi:hypothetical protein